MADFKHREFMLASVSDSPTVEKTAGAEITDVRGLAMKHDGEGNAVVASTKGEAVIGVAIITNGRPKDDCYGYIKKGDGVTIQRRGIGSALSGGEFAIGGELTADTSGKLVKAEAGDFIIGTAEEASTAADSLVRVDISKIGYKPAGE